MNNLTPEQRPDKNGTVVTRWVKPADAGKSAGLKLPAPTATTAHPATYSRVRFDADVSAVIGDRKYSDDDYTKFIDRASDEELKYVYDAIMGNTDRSDMLSQISGIMDDAVEGDVAMAFIATYDQHPDMDDNEVVDFLRGAMRSGSNLPEKYDPSDEKRNKEIMNLCHFIVYSGALDKISDQHVVKGVMSNGLLEARNNSIWDTKLADHIRSHPESSEDLTTILNDKNFAWVYLHYAINHPEHASLIGQALKEAPQMLEDRISESEDDDDSDSIRSFLEGFATNKSLASGNL